MGRLAASVARVPSARRRARALWRLCGAAAASATGGPPSAQQVGFAGLWGHRAGGKGRDRGGAGVRRWRGNRRRSTTALRRSRIALHHPTVVVVGVIEPGAAGARQSQSHQQAATSSHRFTCAFCGPPHNGAGAACQSSPSFGQWAAVNYAAAIRAAAARRKTKVVHSSMRGAW
jgi:hypothetical protein